jgi:hypothetical protein
MRSNYLTPIFLSTFMGCVLISGTAFGKTVGLSETAPQRQNAAQVSTNRSDGAIFPAVIQTGRVQKRRRVRVSTSGQALSNRKLASPQEESALGGRFVAAATGAVEGDAFVSQAQTVIPYVALDVKAKPRVKR